MVFESGDIAPSGGYTQYLAEFFPATRDLFASVPFMAAREPRRDLALRRQLRVDLPQPTGDAR